MRACIAPPRLTMTGRFLLDPTGDLAAEREAIDDEPRPGSWFGDGRADGRMLTQGLTDLLIRAELRAATPRTASAATVAELTGILGDMTHLDLGRGRATCQRGGVDSDPLVRLLAFRAWRNRDRRWFEVRGVRKGDPVAMIGGGHAPANTGRPSNDVALAQGHELAIGRARHDAQPGSWVEVRVDQAAVGSLSARLLRAIRRGGPENSLWRLRVSSRPRAEPAPVVRPPQQGVAPTRAPPMRAAYRFDQLQIERDEASGQATIVAARGGCRAQVRISALELGKGGEVWHRCFAALLEEFERLGAAPAEGSARSR
jgi:hypothetical protein